jgi:ABC-type polar amino acid transport system ATPase subunit
LRRESAHRATLIVTHDLVFAGDVADRVVHLEARELARA